MSLSRLLMALLVLGMAAQLWAGLGRAFASEQEPAAVAAQVELLPAVSAPPPAAPIEETRGIVMRDYEARRETLAERAR